MTENISVTQNSDEWAYLKLTIKVPKSWIPKLDKKRSEMGYPSMAQFVRELLRKVIEG